MGVRFIHPAALALLALVPAAALLFRWADNRRRAALQRFAQKSAASGMVDRRKRIGKRITVLAALAALVVGMARPVWRKAVPEQPANNSDVVFVLDVSRSMLTADAQPTRLDRAKAIIQELVKEFRTERVALVAFAGNCAVQCPLTIDYDYFRERLETADSDSITRGGTRIGDAVAFALNTAFDNVARSRKQLVLLSDGGDQDSSIAGAAQLATEKKVRIVSIGVGNERVASIVPISATDQTPFLYQGHPVTTRLETAALQSLAGLNLGGVYLHAGLNSVNAPQVYRQLLSAVSPLAGGPPQEEIDLYPYLLALCIVLLLGEALVSDRRVLAAAMMFALLAASQGKGDDEDPITAGNRLFQKGNYVAALHFYRLAADSQPNAPQVQFDLALSLYRSEGYEEAAVAFQRAAALSRDAKFRAQCKFGEANAAYRIAMQHSKQLFDFQQALSLYREALTLDPSLTDCKYNIEVVKRKLRELEAPMAAAAQRYMAQSRQDLARRNNTEASQIVQENKNTKKTKGQVGRPKIDTDW